MVSPNRVLKYYNAGRMVAPSRFSASYLLLYNGHNFVKFSKYSPSERETAPAIHVIRMCSLNLLNLSMVKSNKKI